MSYEGMQVQNFIAANRKGLNFFLLLRTGLLIGVFKAYILLERYVFVVES